MKLQNNFTTPEQSRRLLELGLPADSADCIFAIFKGIVKRSILNEKYPTFSKFVNEAGADSRAISSGEHYLPCWSVGRLIEICTICHIIGEFICHISKDTNIVETIINDMEKTSKLLLNFSKLED